MIWKILTLLALLTPLAMVILGLICWRFPPGGPNWALGFRSRRARAGDESWKFAQSWAGKLWFILGLGWLVAVLLVSGGQKEAAVEDCIRVYLNLVGLQIVSLLLVILGMDLALLIRFDRFGRVRVKKEKRKKKPRPERLLSEELDQESVYEDRFPAESDPYLEDDFGEAYFDDGIGDEEYFDSDAPEDTEPFYDEYDPMEDFEEDYYEEEDSGDSF